ncbi:Desumoylating isopeptidase 1 [Blomia tropicalis]|nr:Desumoylating isopeptidase 1 [Blomia tropicalis]
MDEPEQREVFLYIYDMSKGLARTFSTFIIGKELPGIWHTAIIAYEREYFFGGGGIESCIVGGTNLGEPDQILLLGHTQVPYSLFLEFLFSLGESSFAPLGQTFSQYLNTIEIRPTGTGVSFNQPVPAISRQPQPKTEPPAQVESSNELVNSTGEIGVENKKSETMAETEQARTEPEEDNVQDEKETSTLQARRSYKFDDPPIVFKDVDGLAAAQKIEEMVVNLLNPQQQQFLKELADYLQSDNGAWAIGDEHIDLIVFLLSGGDGKFAPNVTLLTLELLQAAALKEDVVLILHQDRKDHRLMSYINRIENLTLAEQEEIVKLLCNLCGQATTFDWLLYISEWCESDGQPASNSRVTVRAAVHTLLNEQLTTLQRNGVNLIYNLSLKDVFEDVAIELSTAVLQYLHSDVPVDQALLCMTVIQRFIEISATDVPALIKMLGPDLGKYKGKCPEMDKMIDEIESKVARLPAFG